jgi:inhibitor of KinA
MSIYPVSENAVTIYFGNELDIGLNHRVFSLYNYLRRQPDSFWVDLIPAYGSLTVVYDLNKIRTISHLAFEWIRRRLEDAITRCDDAVVGAARKLSIPVCYDPVFGLDLKLLSKSKKLSIDQVIELHTAQTYRVFMLGFLPGFAYMAIVDEKIATPRLPSPRKHVPAGSVGIAGNQTGIYPLDSPGGWNIIGRTPVKLFDSHNENPVLFQPGDEVKFYSVSKEEFDSFNQKSFTLLAS